MSFGKQPFDLGIQFLCQGPDGTDPGMVFYRETAADIEDPDLPAGPVFNLLDDTGRDLEGLHVVLEVRALAADMETQPFNNEPVVECFDDQVHCFPGWAPNLMESSTIEPVFGTRIRRTRPAWGAWSRILRISSVVVERDEGFVLVQRLKRLDRLDGIGVDDLVPDPFLPFLFGHIFDILVHDHELGHGCDIEAAADLEQGLDDLGIGIGLDRKIDLDIRHVAFEFPVILPEFLMIDNKNRGTVLCSKVLQEFLADVPDMVDRRFLGPFFLPLSFWYLLQLLSLYD